MTKPLDELEMYELMCAIYPERFKGDDTDEDFDAALCFADEEFGGFENVSRLLGRVAMLTMPMQSGLTKAWSHCLGEVTLSDSNAHMRAIVRRDVSQADAARLRAGGEG